MVQAVPRSVFRPQAADMNMPHGPLVGICLNIPQDLLGERREKKLHLCVCEPLHPTVLLTNPTVH